IQVDAAALDNHLMAVFNCVKQSHPESARGSSRDCVIKFPVAVFCPGVEAEVDYRDFRASIFLLRFALLSRAGSGSDKDRPVYTGPSWIGGEAKELDARGIDAGAGENPTSGSFVAG